MDFTISVLPNEGAGAQLITQKKAEGKGKEHSALHFLETIIWVLVPH